MRRSQEKESDKDRVTEQKCGRNKGIQFGPSSKHHSGLAEAVFPDAQNWERWDGIWGELIIFIGQDEGSGWGPSTQPGVEMESDTQFGTGIG